MVQRPNWRRHVASSRDGECSSTTGRGRWARRTSGARDGADGGRDFPEAGVDPEGIAW